MAPPAEYPKRPSFFAYRFCRLMAKACLANEVGPNVCWLLTTIAMTEDAKGYRDAVTYFNEQLMAVTGFNSADALDRCRKKAIAAGWLHYQPGGKGKAGRYWVLTPERFKTFDDAPSDESPAKYFRENAETTGHGREFTSAKLRVEPSYPPHRCGDNPEASAERTRREPGSKCGENPEASAEHSSLTPNSLPLTLPPPPEARTVGEMIELAKFDELIQAWKAARLPGWEQVQRTSTRVGWFQQRLAEEQWRVRWRDAIARAGKSARCMGMSEGWGGLRIDTFLKSADWVQRLLEGEFDDPREPSKPAANGKPLSTDPFADLEAKFAAEGVAS